MVLDFNNLTAEEQNKFDEIFHKNFNNIEKLLYEIIRKKSKRKFHFSNFTSRNPEENNLLFNINAFKKRDITNRNSSGSASEYSINVTFNLTVMSELNGKKILDKSFSQRSTYKASNVHIDTLNREKKIVDNMVGGIAEEITKDLNLIYN